MLSSTVLLIIAIAAGTWLYKLVHYPAFFSPLAKIPSAHWSCSLSSAWLLWMRWTGRENERVYQAHAANGPAVRLAPNLISVNTFEDGVKTIYQGGFPKPDFYWHGFAVYGMPNLFTIKDNATHRAHKRIFTSSFSKSDIPASKSALCSVQETLVYRALPQLFAAAREGRAIDMIEFNYAYLLDTFVQWQFGRSLRSNLLGDMSKRRMYLDGFFGLAGFVSWQYYFPSLSALLRKVGIFLIPKWVDAGFQKVEQWNVEKCDQAHKLLLRGEPFAEEDHPAVFEQAMKSMSCVQSKPSEYSSRLEIASDMFSLNSGAFETSGNTTTYLLWEMSKRPEWQARLRDELSGLSKPLKFDPQRTQIDTDELPVPRELDELPVLHAIIMETLRLWPSVPGGQPRVVPTTCTLASYAGIPAGTIAQSYASVLHREPSVFPDPLAWKPQRWLEADKAQLAIMKRWFWGFGSGGRGCLGIHLAFYSMKFLVAGMYTNFTTEVSSTGDMAQTDGYLAFPKGQRVEIKFHALEQQ